MGKDLYEIGELPPVGEVPAKMHAQLVRPERFGEPVRSRSRTRSIDVPEIGPHEALVAVMAAGVNFNNVWAARGVPVDVTKAPGPLGRADGLPHRRIGRVRRRVGGRRRDVTNVQVGDRVVVHAGQWNPDDPHVARRRRPRPRRQLPRLGLRLVLGLVRPVHEGAGAPVPAEGRPPHVGGGGRAHAHRRHRLPHAARLAAAHGRARRRRAGVGRLRRPRLARRAARQGAPAAVPSPSSRSTEKGEYATSLGAVGYVNRTDFDHWGVPPAWDSPDWKGWFEGAKAFGKAIWDVLGEKTIPRIVFEHPGQDTIPTSIFVCDRGGMVVICAGTTGYDTMIDVRYLWYMQKRFQGSHLFNDEQARAFNDLVIDGKVADHARRRLPLRAGRRGPPADGRRQAPGGQRGGPRRRAVRGAHGPAVGHAPLPAASRRRDGLHARDQVHRVRDVVRAQRQRLRDRRHALSRAGPRRPSRRRRGPALAARRTPPAPGTARARA